MNLKKIGVVCLKAIAILVIVLLGYVTAVFVTSDWAFLGVWQPYSGAHDNTYRLSYNSVLLKNDTEGIFFVHKPYRPDKGIRVFVFNAGWDSPKADYIFQTYCDEKPLHCSIPIVAHITR